eukprot:gnl/TRDRNA2_/TRDRNA2_82931_c0_seq1.p1 gnl/TRDRNA2_/TRDRNA2_82931_c0~~gnl/TRDRNA2_/TRDRNA2_82931_c0_seq1.p1  ORF type:complete len:325 (-),score=29.03 gnl/TRDRNA2_/TRDRNA2_82931_c0_seq1:104-1078(-)
MSACERDDGEWRLLNPLHIRFSQPRISPHFRDGRHTEDTSRQVKICPFYGGGRGGDLPPYDSVLIPPFPAVRVISWRPKIRNSDGEAERDETGKAILGERAWFALDNRRLFSLQHVAAKHWPQRFCVVVRCLEEVPGQSDREVRKFRTTTEGKLVDVGHRPSECAVWYWPKAAPPGVQLKELEPEGLFAEDLWDARDWVPEAVDAAIAAGPSDGRGDREPAIQEAVTVRAQQKNEVEEGGGLDSVLISCPDGGWQYRDPAGRIQGPFVLQKMRQWHEHGYFLPDLPMRCSTEDPFMPFAEIFPPQLEPFTSYVVRFRKRTCQTC